MKAIVMRYESEITEGLRFYTVEPTMFPWGIVFGTLEIAKHKSTDIFGAQKRIGFFYGHPLCSIEFI